MPRYEGRGDAAERARGIWTNAMANDWDYQRSAAIPTASYRAAGLFAGAPPELQAKNVVRGQIDDGHFTYFEAQVPGGRVAAFAVETPFPSPGLWCGPSDLLRAHDAKQAGPAVDLEHAAFQTSNAVRCNASGFAEAVLEPHVLDVMLDNPGLMCAWYGSTLILYTMGPPSEWNDFVDVAEVVSRLMTRMPEMEFIDAAAHPLPQATMGRRPTPVRVQYGEPDD